MACGSVHRAWCVPSAVPIKDADQELAQPVLQMPFYHHHILEVVALTLDLDAPSPSAQAYRPRTHIRVRASSGQPANRLGKD